MARTSFSGPAYGAQQLLFVVHKDTVATSQTDLEIFEIDVPATEDWYVTHVRTYCDAAGAVAATLDIEDDTVSILAAAITLVADDSVSTSVTADSGEAGKRIAASSNVTVDATTGSTTAPDDITVHVYGYVRYVGPEA
jgi:hypothetical protein